MYRVRALLFDLDGTLVDSRRDLAAALDLTLADLGLPPLGVEAVTRLAGDGARRLVERGLTAARPDAVFSEAFIAAALEIFQARYGERLLATTQAYPGVLTALEHFAALPKAVVTNKPAAFSEAILKGLGLRSRFVAVIGGDTLPERKPHPAPALAGLAACGVKNPADAVMIGDSPNDIRAGRAAGTLTCAVTYGFRPAHELTEAEVVIDDLSRLGEWFRAFAPRSPSP
ncbi:MAG: phosphoglycolate phosphatase [Chloracidobacterium sp. CP2_5A]|nr:MAG: phosphoglycolate phosphatase [Chloracidobacterium sp. CP2_5A]